MSNNNQQQHQVKIDLSKSTPIVCSACGDDIFVNGFKFRKISKLITGTPQDAVIPIEVFLCGSCGAVNEELLPNELK